MFPNAETSDERLPGGNKTSNRPGVQTKLDKMLLGTQTMSRIFGSQNKLPLTSRDTVREEDCIFLPVHHLFPSGESRFSQTLSASPWTNGLSNYCGETGASNDEGFPMIGRITETTLLLPLTVQSEIISDMYDSSLRCVSGPIQLLCLR